MTNVGSSEPCFFALTETRELGRAVAAAAGVELAGVEERRFEGGEFKLRPLQSVRGRVVFVMQSLAGTSDMPVCERFLRLLFLLHTLRDAGARECVALIPYLAFARKDRRTQLRDPVNTRYVAQQLEATGVGRVVALDVHNGAALDNSFRIPVDHLSALPMMVNHFVTRFPQAKLAVASPDIGGVKRAQIFRELLELRLRRNIELVFVEKRRAHGTVSGGTLVGDVANTQVIVLDDLCATGGTLVRAAESCRQAGAAGVHVAVTHAPQAAGIETLTKAEMIASAIITDSVGNRLTSGAANDSGAAKPETAGKLVTLSIAPLYGEAVRRMVAGQPLAPLFGQWPVSPQG